MEKNSFFQNLPKVFKSFFKYFSARILVRYLRRYFHLIEEKLRKKKQSIERPIFTKSDGTEDKNVYY